ncbi:VWA domain-containing protein [Bacillus gobiensis]|uniref:vWA domain-containing protein n=1 Tax=Bacillus gobiensis TaxID=1441095 RepID=UPI003D1AD552
MKFIKFNDSTIDSFLFMEMNDLAKTLSSNHSVEVEYGVQSYYHPYENKIYMSHFWKDRPYEDLRAGLKSDIYLRSIGSRFHSFPDTANFLRQMKGKKLSSLAKQLVSLFEDIRIEELVKSSRPGTKSIFQQRRELYRKHFRTQLTLNKERSIFTDALFCGIYLKLTADSPLEEIPDIREDITAAKPYIESQLSRIYDARSTNEIIVIARNLVDLFEEILNKDMLNTYFFLPDISVVQLEEAEKLEENTKLSEDIALEDQEKEEKDVEDETLPTWHRETNAESKSFLQFDVEHGAKTNRLGNSFREGDDGDQAFGVVQGRSRQSKRKDYSKLESHDAVNDEPANNGNDDFGKENKFAVAKFTSPHKPTLKETLDYQIQVKSISFYKKKLKQMIQKTLEHKRTQPKTNLHAGRLNKKLLRYFTEENPRLFYKKQELSKEIDAAFLLLVDCSASMFDKMDETKKGIALFHESLKSVQVKHQVIGFWEEEATEEEQPNYFKTIIPFEQSLKRVTGPEIMQLEPEEDNRDGFAIRQAIRMFRHRHEKQKFLIVFSDGEPAAYGYEQNGIVDTHEAVITARKRGIEVINVFLSNSQIEEAQKKTIQNMYGRYSLFVPNVDQLPDVLYPLLKKLLNKSIV